MTRKVRLAWALSMFLAGGTIVSTLAGVFEPVEVRLIDWNLRRRPAEPEQNQDIVLIEIENACLERHGELPWSRELWARMILAAKDAGARVIGCDALFDQPGKEAGEDDALEAALREAGNVILAAEHKSVLVLDNETGDFRTEFQVRRPLPRFDAAALGVGLVNVDYQRDNVDGILRILPLAAKTPESHHPALSLALASHYLSLEPVYTAGGGVRLGTYDVPTAPPIDVVQHALLLDEGVNRNARFEGSAYVNYRSWDLGGVFHSFKASELLGGQVPAAELQGRIVLIGVDVTGVDRKLTPLGLRPGVEVQAAVLRNLLLQDFLQRIDRFYLVLLLLGAAVLVPWVLLGYARSWLVPVALMALPLGNGWLALLLFERQGFILDVLPMAVLVISQIVGMKLFLLASDLRTKLKNLELLNLYSRRFNATLDLEQLRIEILQSIEVLTGARFSMIGQDPDGTGELDVVSPHEVPPELIQSVGQPSFQQGLQAGWKKTLAPRELSEMMPGIDLDVPEGPRVVVLPLVNHDSASGWLMLAGDELTPQLLDREDRDFWNTLGSIAHAALENARLYKLATVDALTSLYVRHFFDIVIEREFGRAARYGGNVALLLTDVDHFKNFNDTYGHQVGDRVLRMVAAEVRRCVRLVDVACRYGGEEFAVILPETDLEGARLTAERIRQRIEEMRVPHGDKELSVTISIGLASRETTRAHSSKQFIKEADDALYEAKDGGRNQVRCFGV